MSEFKKWLSPKDQILYALYKHREGYGFNELRDACGGLHGRYIDIFTNPKKGKLVKDGFIVIKKVMGKGGTKELRMITEKGVEYVEKNIIGVESAVRNVSRLAQVLTEKERFEVLGQLFKDMYEYAFSLFKSGERLNMMRVFRDASLSPVKDFLNKEMFAQKKDILKRQNFWKPYYVPVFELRELCVAFLLKDMEMAWDLRHYLNQHHRDFLTNFNIQTKETVEQRNNAWIEKHKGYKITAVENEIEIRKDLLTKQFPDIAKLIPSDYGTKYADTH